MRRIDFSIASIASIAASARGLAGCSTTPPPHPTAYDYIIGARLGAGREGRLDRGAGARGR